MQQLLEACCELRYVMAQRGSDLKQLTVVIITTIIIISQVPFYSNPEPSTDFPVTVVSPSLLYQTGLGKEH